MRHSASISLTSWFCPQSVKSDYASTTANTVTMVTIYVWYPAGPLTGSHWPDKGDATIWLAIDLISDRLLHSPNLVAAATKLRLRSSLSDIWVAYDTWPLIGWCYPLCNWQI